MRVSEALSSQLDVIHDHLSRAETSIVWFPARCSVALTAALGLLAARGCTVVHRPG